jgi:predicted transcriptional regulator
MQRDADQARIILNILESVDRDGERSQRSRASEIGIALGLTNAYLKFCIRKGYLKARKISARSYQYMLTPKGFAEKSRLALSRLSDSLTFVRATRGEFANLFAEAEKRQWQSTVLVGASTLAEICVLCAMERGIRIVAIVDPQAQTDRMLGLPVYRDFAPLAESFSGAVIAELEDTGSAMTLAETALGADRVLIPAFLRAILPKREAA